MGSMWSPFAPIKRYLALVLGTLQGLNEALGGILGTMRVLVDAVHSLKQPGRTNGALEEQRVDALEVKVQDLTLAVSEGVQRVQRSENRVRHIVQGAKRELADAGFEHPGVEAEARELRELDGGGGDHEAVPAVQEVVAHDPPLPSPIPGMSMSQFRLSQQRQRRHTV